MMPLPLPCTPSQNILQLLQKRRDILEWWYPTISLKDGTRVPSEFVAGDKLTINWVWILGPKHPILLTRLLMWPTRPISLMSLLWPKARPKAMLWPKAGPKDMLWPKAGPEAKLWPKARPEAELWPKAGPKTMLHPTISTDEGVCAPSETETTINLRRQQSFRWDTTVCSFTTIRKALHSLFELGWVDVLPPARSDFLSWHSPRFEELVTKTWWEWTPHFNSAPMAPKEEKRTNHVCVELCLSFLRVEWEYNLSRGRKTSVWVDHRKLLESRLFCPGICHSFGWGKDKSGRMLRISLSRSSPIVTWPVTICLLWALITFGRDKDKSGRMLWISLSRSSPIVTQPVTKYLTWMWLTPWTVSNV